MAKTLKQMIGWEAQTGIIRDPLGGIPADVFPPEFMRVNRRIQGDTGTFKIVAGNRKLAQRVNRGAPSKKVEKGIVSEVPFKVNHVYEHITHPTDILDALMSYDSPALQNFGQEEIDRTTVEFRQRLNNLRLAMVYSALLNGYIWFDGDGNLLPNATGAVITIDFQIPTTVRGNINGTANVLLGGAAAKWSAAGTDILGQMMAIGDLSAQLTGYVHEYAIYGNNIPGYLVANTAFGKTIENDPAAQTALRMGVIPDNTLGIRKWVRAGRAFFEDSSGTIQAMSDANKVILTPRPTPDWWEVVEGTYRIPTDLGGVALDASGSRAQFEQVTGMFSYATICDDPPGIKHYHGDDFLPLQKVTKAVFHMTVHW